MEEFIWPVNASFTEDCNWNTVITKYEDGKEQRRKKWSSPKRSFNVAIRGRSDTVMNQIWDFYNARCGAYETFYFENTNESPVVGEVVGTTNGVSSQFNLDHYPIPSGGITTLTVGGVEKTETTDYTLAYATGLITFNEIPASGDSVVATYPFCRIVRFAEDKLSRELFAYKLYNSDMKFIETI